MAKKKINNPVTLSEKGRRKNNEDMVLGEVSPNGATGDCVVIAVADGMGGLEAGEMASKAVHDMLYNLHQGGLLGEYSHIYGRIKDCIKTANRNIYEWSQKKAGIQMGTTVSGAIIIGNRYLIFNIGDSRTYLIRKEGIKQVTTDHSVDTEAFQAGLISKEEIGKGTYSNALTRTVGTDPHVDVDIFPHGHFSELAKGDILFCCTDGLWGKVANENIRREMMDRNDLYKSFQVLCNLALKKGSKDNISMAAYRYGEFIGTPAKDEKSGSKAPKEKEKKKKVSRKPKISLPHILIPLLVGFLVVIISLLNNYLSTPKNDITKVEIIIPIPKHPGTIFDPRIKKGTNDSIQPIQTDVSPKEQNPPVDKHPKPGNIKQKQPVSIPRVKPQNTQPPPVKTIETPIVFLNQLDPDIRANIEAKFKLINVRIDKVESVTRIGNYQVIIALDSNGALKSIDIPGIVVKPEGKLMEFKSVLSQKIISMNFPPPTINGKPVNVKIGMSFFNIIDKIKDEKYFIFKY